MEKKKRKATKKVAKRRRKDGAAAVVSFMASCNEPSDFRRANPTGRETGPKSFW